MTRHAISRMILCAAVALVGSVARAQDPLDVVATLTDFGTIAAAVGGEKVRVTTIASGVQDPHFVDPKPSYVVKLRDADLLLVNGLDLEIGWLPPLLDSARNGRIRVGGTGYVDCSKNVPLLEVPTGTMTRAEGDVHAFGNPHYTTDPLNGKLIADTIAAALSRARPADSAYFEARKKAFQGRLDDAMFGKELVELAGGKKLERLARAGELEAFLASGSTSDLSAKLGGWAARMAPLRGTKAVFYHKSYSYFIARFGLRVSDFVELKPGIQPGPGHLAELVSTMRRDNVKLLATHPFYDEKIGKLVADKAGARLVVLPLNVAGIKGADDYLKMFDGVVDTLTRALVSRSQVAGKPRP
jgi:zinc/manganese transport system substrate-binding protein